MLRYFIIIIFLFKLVNLKKKHLNSIMNKNKNKIKYLFA